MFALQLAFLYFLFEPLAALELDVLQIADHGHRRSGLVVQGPAVGDETAHPVLVRDEQVADSIATAADHDRAIGLEDRDDAQGRSLGQAVSRGDLVLLVVQNIADELLVGRVEVVRHERGILAVDQLHAGREGHLARGLLADHGGVVRTPNDLVVALLAGRRVGVARVVVGDLDGFARLELGENLVGREVGVERDGPLPDLEREFLRHDYRLQRSNQS